MKRNLIILCVSVSMVSLIFVTKVFAQYSNITIDSIKAVSSNPGYISDAGKESITISGIAPQGSTVFVSLTDSGNPTNSITTTQVIPIGITSYEINLNGRLAKPQPLQDGLIRVSAYAKALGSDTVIGPPISYGLIQQTALPDIYIIGDNPFKCRLRAICADLGAVAFDSLGNKLSVTVLNLVRTSVEGNYSIRYSAVDSAGNSTTTTRRVSIFTTISNTSLSTTTPEMTNIPNPIPVIISTSSAVILPVPPAPVVITAPASTTIKISGILETIKRQLLIGVSGPDVKLLQTILSGDKAIYPEGLTTGYFGNLTRNAVQRFQEKYGVASSGNAGYGQVGPRTRAKLIELFGN